MLGSDIDTYAISNNIFAIGGTYLGMVSGGTTHRYAIQEISGTGKADSIENNAFVDLASSNTALNR